MLAREHHQRAAAAESSEVRAFLKSLSPGQPVDLVITHEGGSPLEVRQAILFEIDLHRGLVVGQPEPKIPKAAKGQRLELTVIKRGSQRDAGKRVGFYTTIAAFIDSETPENSSRQLLVLTLPQELHQVNLRSSYRVPIPSSLTLPISLRSRSGERLDVKVDLINLSAGGAFISYHHPPGAPPLLRAGDIAFIEVDLTDALQRFDMRSSAVQPALGHLRTLCRVVRMHDGPDVGCHAAALAFMNLNMQQKDLLHMLVLKIQRFLVSKPGDAV